MFSFVLDFLNLKIGKCSHQNQRKSSKVLKIIKFGILKGTLGENDAYVIKRCICEKGEEYM
jgi:hypothetical protein